MNASSNPSWRELIPVHPAADLFPMMTEAELTDLGTDIVRNGLTQPIVFYAESFVKPNWQLLDGRNRLAAMEAVGLKVDIGIIKRRSHRKGCPYLGVSDQDGEYIVDGDNDVRYETVADPYKFVVSTNIRRRHLNGEQKRELIAALLKANPEKSNRTIASTVQANDKTVGVVRRELEATAEIPQLDKTVGKDGKARSTASPREAVTRNRKDRKDVEEGQKRCLMGAWNAASPEVKAWFKNEIDQPVMDRRFGT